MKSVHVVNVAAELNVVVILAGFHTKRFQAYVETIYRHFKRILTETETLGLPKTSERNSLAANKSLNWDINAVHGF